MPAEVEDGAEPAISSADDDDPLALLGVDEEVAGFFYGRLPSNVDPFPGEDLLVLALVDFLVGIILARERRNLLFADAVILAGPS